MKAEVRGMYTTSMDHIETYVPEDYSNFCVWVRATVGSQGEDGAESFDIGVCSPQWLAGQVESDGFVAGRHYLIVREYDVEFIKNVITDLIERCEGETWAEVADKVGRIGYWEFEDYRPAPR